MVAAAGAVVLLTTRGARAAFVVALLVIGAALTPWLAVAVGVAVGVQVLFTRAGQARLEGEAAEAEVVLLAELIGLGLSAGGSLLQSFRSAVPHLKSGLAHEVRTVERLARQVGGERALAAVDGRAHRLYRLAARSMGSGSSLLPAVEAFVEERRHTDHALAMARARRLPVRLLVPLALLILPGFVVLAVGPALIDAMSRLTVSP